MKANKTLGIIFSNMHDDALGELTEKRTMGSIPVGGRYRMIDFVLSNMVNSGITNVGVVTKSNYQSLMDHIGSGREWDLARKIGGLCILPPFSRSSSGIYRGRLEALAGIIGYIRHSSADYVVLADCDLIANMDYSRLLKDHLDSGADITVVYQRQTMSSGTHRYANVLEIDANRRVTGVLIHPDLEGERNVYLNVAVLSRELLERISMDAISRNLISFTRDVLQQKAGQYRINAYEFTRYCATVNCMKSYFKANMEMIDPRVRAELFPRLRPIYTKVRDQVPAKFGLEARVKNSLVADGCIIEGEVENSVIFRSVTVGPGVKIKNSIIMQGTSVEAGANLDYVITDKDVLIKNGRNLMGFETYPIYIAKGSAV